MAKRTEAELGENAGVAERVLQATDSELAFLRFIQRLYHGNIARLVIDRETGDISIDARYNPQDHAAVVQKFDLSDERHAARVWLAASARLASWSPPRGQALHDARAAGAGVRSCAFLAVLRDIASRWGQAFITNIVVRNGEPHYFEFRPSLSPLTQGVMYRVGVQDPEWLIPQVGAEIVERGKDS